MKRLVLIVAVLAAPACHPAVPPPTPIAVLANTSTQIEQSANAILHAAVDAATVVIPSTGKPLVSTLQKDQVALAVNRIGKLGKILQSALNDYGAIKAAGGNITQQQAAVQQAVSDIADALTAVGNAIPNGTVDAIDHAVDSLGEIILQVRNGVGL
jgi:hypothetical protein